MGLGSLGQVAYDIIANDKTSDGVGSAKKGFGDLVITLGDLKNAFMEIDGVAQKISHGYASLSSYAEQAALSTGLTSDATSELIKELWNADTPLEEAGNLIIELGRAGLTSADDIRTIGVACDTLGDALGVPADTLSNMLIPAFKAFGMSAQDIPKNIDKIAYTLKNCNVNFDEWSRTLTKLGPDLGKMGLSLTDVNALLLVMKDHGYQGRNMLSDLSKAMGESSDTNKDGKVSLDELCTALGITTEELNKQRDALDESQGTAEKWADAANRMYTASDEFSQAVEELSTNLGPLSEALAAITGPGTMVMNLLLSLAALKTLGIGGMFAGIGTSLTGAASGAGVFTAAAAPLIAVLAGIGLGLAAVYAMNELGVFDWIYNAGYEFGGFVIGAGADFREWLDGVPGWCENASTGAVNWFTSLPGAIGGAVASIPDTVGGAFSGLVDIVTGALGGIPGALSGAFSSIADAFSTLGGKVQEAFTNLFTGISEFIVNLAQGFIAAGYNIIMFIVQGMQSAAGAVGDVIGNIFGIIGQFIPHSPAETGPLSQLPNFGAYFVEPLLATVPAVQAASAQVAEAVVMPAAQPPTVSGGTHIGYQDNSAPVEIGSINASSDYPIDRIMADIAAAQAQRRAQRGYIT